MKSIIQINWTIVFLLLLISGFHQSNAQILLIEECFEGGVISVGTDYVSEGSQTIKCPIDWNENSNLERAYAITYRYGLPESTTVNINNISVVWSMESMVGSSLPTEIVDFTATHVQELPTNLQILNDTLDITFDSQSDLGLNWGYWGIYIILIYSNPSITELACLRHYIANQPPDIVQTYSIQVANAALEDPVLLAIHSGRISESYSDRSVAFLNNFLLGEFWGADPVMPAFSGVQGHFDYKNAQAFGLNGDTSNSTFLNHDAIAVINEQLDSWDPQELILYRENGGPSNVHASFALAYTPDCNFLPDLSSMQRQYSFCRGESLELEAVEGYDNYQWQTTTGSTLGLINPNTANTICNADTSRWYTVRMWNDDEEGCSQTIPVFVEVNTIPVPGNLDIRASTCPANTGRITVNEVAGNGPFSYSLDGQSQSSNVFQNLEPGDYSLNITSAQGCSWDTLISVPLDSPQEAAFNPNPPSGLSPLEVFFDNRSSDATGFLWLINGEEISTSENLLYTFADSGQYEISLVAFLNEPTCADTATYILQVVQGIEILMPNIISPNGDGQNDDLVALVKGIAECRWFVFNRWGVELNAGVSAPLDDLRSGMGDEALGTLNIWRPNADLPDGVYSVVFQATGLSGQVEEMVFEVVLSR
jgi:PKD repeat protein